MRKQNTLRQAARQRGSSLVEGALCLMVILGMLIGILDIGQVLFIRASVQERVRDALRQGVIEYDAAAIQNHVLYGTRTPAEGAQPAFNLTAGMVEVTRLDQNTAADRVKVTVSNYPIDFYTPFIAGRITGPPIYAVAPMERGNLPQ
jgi:Flp pilus assembly protein TadG